MNPAIAHLRNPTLLLDLGAPIAAYYGLHAAGVGDVAALTVAAVFPLAAVAVTAARARRLDPIGAVSALFVVVGIVTALLVGDPRMLLAVNAVPGAVVGLAYLVSLAATRPLLVHLTPRWGDRDRWASDAGFRATMRAATAVWGGALIANGVLHAAVALLLEPSIAVGISPVLLAATIGPAVVWTARVGRRAGTPRR